jgi:GTPase
LFHLSASNKTCVGINLLKLFIKTRPLIDKQMPPCFTVDRIYNVKGHGLVVSGYNGININCGDMLYIGPLHNGSFLHVRVKSIHDDYRNEMDHLAAGTRGCLCINYKDRRMLRRGMILMPNVPTGICKTFKADIQVYHHHTTIKRGYNAYINVGAIRESVKFIEFFDNKGNILEVARSGDSIIAELEFMKYCNFIQKGQKVIFREGTMRGVGKIL